MVVGVQQPLRRQVDERLADGGRGDAVLLGYLLDRELLARLEPSPQHLVAQRVGDLLPQGAAGHGAAAAAPAAVHGRRLPRPRRARRPTAERHRRMACSSVCTSTPPYAFDEFKGLCEWP
jgi:hypothetical protein